MATIRREVQIQAAPDQVWDALRDVGALHTRLCPEFVVDTRMEGDTRMVTFANGRQAKELIVSVDEDQRRVCWAIVDEPFVHYNGAAQVTPLGDGSCRFTWISDLLPHELAPTVTAMIEAGIAAIKRKQEAA
ncbi:SRPBCC family protein [Steroidobacter flavus]|uniref:SRPBCC family protein n=1 Tax=Steroidobacter flavus TaxID=1842136 RepID=A0ABV8STY2_9GAMM